MVDMAEVVVGRDKLEAALAYAAALDRKQRLLAKATDAELRDAFFRSYTNLLYASTIEELEAELVRRGIKV